MSLQPGAILERKDRNVRLCIEPDLVEQIRAQVIAGYKALPRRGLEVAGILFGEIARKELETTVAVHRFEAIPCEHRFGPSFRLSDGEVSRLENRLRSGEGNRVVGLWRSHTSPGTALRPEDLRLFRDCFSKEHVFLLIRPSPGGSCTAGVLLWNGDAPETEVCEREVPFGSNGLPSLAPRMEEPKQDPMLPAPVPSSPVPGTVPPERVAPGAWRTGLSRFRGLWRRQSVAALAGIAVLLATAYLAGGSRRTATAPQPVLTPESDLDLQVSQQDSQLVLTWNRDASGLRDSSGAVLFVRDGRYQQSFHIDSRQLQTGSIFYTPSSSDVQFRLEVGLPQSRTAAESIRVIQAGALRDPLPPSPILEELVDVPDHVIPAGESRNTAAREIQYTGGSPDVGPSMGQGAQSEARVNYVAPRIAERSFPVVPRRARRMIRQETLIRVLVKIAPDGTVTEASAAPAGDPLSRILRESSLYAAYLFHFEPARANGQPVPGEAVLSFRFTP